MAQIGTIEGVLKLRDELTSKLQRAASNVEKAGKRMQRVGGQISSVGSGINRNISLPLAAAGAAAFKFSSDFSTSLTKIETLVGVNRETVQGWRDDILKLSGETALAPRELADAMFFVTSAGLRGEVALETLTASAQAAALGLGDTASIADAATSAMNAYGPATLSAGNATNILALAVRAGKLEAAELAPVMGRLLPTASSLGIAFEDVAGVMAVMSRTGLNAAEASTSLNSIMNLLAKGGTKQAKKVLSEVGLSMGDLRDMAAKPGGLIEAMRLLDERTSNLSEEALAQVIPNIRAFRGVMNVLAQDSRIVDDVMGQVASGVDVLGSGMRRVAEEPGFKFQQMLQKGKIRLIELGDQLAPTFLKLIDLGTKFLGLIGRWIEAFSRLSPASQKVILAIGGIAIAAGPALIVTGKLITAWGVLVAMSPKVVAAVASVSGAFLPAAVAIGGFLVLDSRITAWADSVTEDLRRIADEARQTGEVWNELRLQISQGLGLVEGSTFLAANEQAIQLRQQIKDREQELLDIQEQRADAVAEEVFRLNQREKQVRQDLQADKQKLQTQEKLLEAAKEGLKRSEALRKKSEEIAKQVAKADEDRERSLKRQEALTEKMLEARLRAVQVELSLTHETEVNRLLLAASAEEANLIQLALEKGLDPLTEMTDVNRRLLLLLQNQEELLENHLELANEIVEAMENALSLRRGVEFDPLLITPVTSDEFLDAAGLSVEAISRRAEEMNDAFVAGFLETSAADLQAHLDESWNAWLESLETASMDKAFQNLAEGLQQAFSDTFKRIFDEGLKGFEGLVDAVKDLVANVLSESLASELSSIIAEQITILRKKIQQAMQGEGGFGEALNSVLGGTGGIWATVGIVAANIIASDNKAAAAAATAIGTAIGFAVGTYVFPVVLGPALGAQLGAIFGSILGTFIKSGTPEFFAAVEAEAGKITFGESAMGAGFQRVGGTIGREISSTVDAVLGQLGASLVGISDDITLKLKNGLSVFLGSQEFDFGDAMAEGLEFAIVEIIKRSDLGNIEPEVERALQFSSANTIDELLSDLQFARDQIRSNLDQIAQRFLQFVDEAKAAASRLQSLGLDPGIAFQKLGSQLIDLRDQILGVQEDPAARIRRQAAALNARIRILEAEQQAKEAQLQFERETLTAEIALLKAELGIAGQSINIKKEMLRADQQITQAEQGLLRTKLKQLAAVDAALSAAQSILANLPALISDEEITRAIGRLGGGGGARRAFEDRIREITTSLLPQFAQGLLELSRRYDELLEQARRYRRSEEEILELRRREAQAMGQQIRDRISEFLTPNQGGTFGLSKPQRQAQEIRQRFEEIREQTAALLEQENELALTREEILEAERRAMEKLGESVIDGLSLPLEETRNRIGSLKDSLGFLWQQTLAGEMAFERFADIIAQAGDQAFLSLGDSILGFVDKYGIEIENMEAFRLKLERVRFELERANLVLQFELLREIGILTEEMIEFIAGALGEIMDLEFPDIQIPDAPSRGRDRRGGPGDATPDQSPVVDAINQQEQQLERILESWRASAERSASDQLQILRDQRQQAMELARELGKDIDRVLEEFRGALERFTDQLLEGVRGVREEIATGAAGGAARLAPTARLARAEEQLRQQVASVLGGDLDAVDRVDDLARQTLNALGDVFLGGGRAFDVRAGEIDRLLELVEQQVQQQVQAQGNSDAAMAPANQQTQADILAALGASNNLLREIRDEGDTGEDELRALLRRLASSQESLVEQLGRMT